MSLFKKIKISSSAASRIAEEQYYEVVVDELQQGIKRGGLWAKALSKSEGNEEKAKGLYISYRVQSIKDELEISEALEKESTLQERNRVVLNRNKRIKKCIESLNTLGFKVKPKNGGWVIFEFMGGRHNIESLDELELYEHERKKEYKERSERPKYDKWTDRFDNEYTEEDPYRKMTRGIFPVVIFFIILLFGLGLLN
ncbi:MAG: hypothetical protein L3J75_14300 [Methylococcaceae bacterium]|nr:hypothetical protein [Methylococcaceae bacterium]